MRHHLEVEADRLRERFRELQEAADEAQERAAEVEREIEELERRANFNACPYPHPDWVEIEWMRSERRAQAIEGLPDFEEGVVIIPRPKHV